MSNSYAVSAIYRPGLTLCSIGMVKLTVRILITLLNPVTNGMSNSSCLLSSQSGKGFTSTSRMYAAILVQRRDRWHALHWILVWECPKRLKGYRLEAQNQDLMSLRVVQKVLKPKRVGIHTNKLHPHMVLDSPYDYQMGVADGDCAICDAYQVLLCIVYSREVVAGTLIEVVKVLCRLQKPFLLLLSWGTSAELYKRSNLTQHDRGSDSQRFKRMAMKSSDHLILDPTEVCLCLMCASQQKIAGQELDGLLDIVRH